MSANVESMFYTNREKPWHGLGTSVSEALTSADALKAAGLDWRVEQEAVYTESGIFVPATKCNFRNTDHAILGIVSDRYKIVQNKDAFKFTDELIGGDVHYDTAGSLNGGKRVWMLAKMPERTVAGDAFEPYLCFTNTHDGTGCVTACMTPIRVVCNNTLNLALEQARRKWSVRHTGTIHNQLAEARMCLEMAEKYMYNLDKTADRLANTRVTLDEMEKYLDELFPLKPDDGIRKKNNVKEAKEQFIACFLAPDLARFAGTAWAAVNAASDMATHIAPQRNTKDFRENNWGRVITGHPLVEQTMALFATK